MDYNEKIENESLRLRKSRVRQIEYFGLYMLFITPAFVGSFYFIAKAFSTGESMLIVGEAIFFLVIGVPVATAMFLGYSLEKIEMNESGMQFYQQIQFRGKEIINSKLEFVEWSAVKSLHIHDGKPEIELRSSAGKESERINLFSFKDSEDGYRYAAAHLPSTKVDPDVRRFLEIDQ